MVQALPAPTTEMQQLKCKRGILRVVIVSVFGGCYRSRTTPVKPPKERRFLRVNPLKGYKGSPTVKLRAYCQAFKALVPDQLRFRLGRDG